jgi:hypothetical protein
VVCEGRNWIASFPNPAMPGHILQFLGHALRTSQRVGQFQ